MAQDASTNPNQNQTKGYPVKIFIYDLSQGMASTYSQQLIGKQVDGIWHTSIIVFEKEYFYGGGIQSDNPGRTPYGTPLRRIEMGETFKTQSQFHEFLEQAAPRFSPSKYDLFKHNCNTFADQAMRFLNDRPIPEYITALPEEFLNSAVGQMLKPMIDNMQQTAMAQYGDWGGVGIANKPHLPPLNPKYNKQITPPQQSPNDNDNTNTSSQDPNANNKQSQAQSSSQVTDGLKQLLSTEHATHKHQTIDLKVIPKELSTKMTNDDRNGGLYISMIENQSNADGLINDGHKDALNSLGAYLKDRTQRQVNGYALEVLDELLLMTECKELFPLVSLLRLLLIDSSVCSRYCADFMIINQILYKIGIPFETVVKDGDNANEEEKEDMEMNLMDIALLQFTSIAAVSHLYLGYDVAVDENFINLGLNALRVENCNVRLSASRLLFNMVCAIKCVGIKEKKDGREALRKIMDGVCNYLEQKTDKHVPTVYRLLCIVGVVLYCNSYDEKALNELNLSRKRMELLMNNINENVKPQNEAIRDLQNDIALLL